MPRADIIKILRKREDASSDSACPVLVECPVSPPRFIKATRIPEVGRCCVGLHD